MMAKAVKVLLSLLSNQQGRQLLKKVLLIVLAPFIGVVIIIIAFGSALSNHNHQVMDVLFNNSQLSSDIPNEFKESINEIKLGFSRINNEINKLDNIEKPLDQVFIQSILLSLMIEDEYLLNKISISEFLKCFYQEETQEPVQDEEAIIILKPIQDTTEILNRCSQYLPQHLSLNQDIINELYYVGLTGRNQSLDQYISLNRLLKELHETSDMFDLEDYDFASPFKENWRFYVSSEFGERDPILLPDGTMTSNFHTGIDLARPLSTPVLAIQSGQVVAVKFTTVGLGFYTIIDHGEGFFSVYGHLSRIHVYEDEMVSKGQVIGEVGSTGYSTGPHLHLEIIEHTKQVNPRKYLK